MATRKNRQVRLTDAAVQRAQDIAERTGINERTVLSMSVEAGLPAVEKATAHLGAESVAAHVTTGEGK